MLALQLPHPDALVGVLPQVVLTNVHVAVGGNPVQLPAVGAAVRRVSGVRPRMLDHIAVVEEGRLAVAHPGSGASFASGAHSECDISGCGCSRTTCCRRCRSGAAFLRYWLLRGGLLEEECGLSSTRKSRSISRERFAVSVTQPQVTREGHERWKAS